MALHRKVTATVVSAFVLERGCSLGHAKFRQDELGLLQAQADQLCMHGFVEIEGVEPSAKQVAWLMLRPALYSHYVAKFPAFSTSSPAPSWPRPDNGKTYEMTVTKKVDGLPLLVSSNYTAQALSAYLVSSNLSLVHFGPQTHYKLKLLISPLWFLLGDSFSPSNMGRPMHSLHGEDQAWHIPSFPNEVKKPGAKPKNSHYDGGRNGVYSKGIPDSQTEDCQSDSIQSQRRMLKFMLKQLAIMFYCETPGTLEPRHGATGFYSSSHLAMLEALRRASLGGGGISWSNHSKAVREVYENKRALQPTTGEGRAYLALGTLVHTAMWGSELMKGEVRVIQNAKIHRKGKDGEEREDRLVDEILLDGGSHLCKLAGCHESRSCIEMFPGANSEALEKDCAKYLEEVERGGR